MQQSYKISKSSDFKKSSKAQKKVLNAPHKMKILDKKLKLNFDLTLSMSCSLKNLKLVQF